MKFVSLLFCLILVVSINASDNFWCLKRTRSTNDCEVCYNSDLVDGKCTCTKILGCQYIGKDGKCIQCESDFYLAYQPAKKEEQCIRVTKYNIVDQCARYSQLSDNTVTCKACQMGYMPAGGRNVCWVSTAGKCAQ